MRIFLSAGEASGDAYAAALARELRKDSIHIEGIGGRKLAEVANGKVLDSSEWGAISIVQSLGVAPKVIRGYYQAKAMLGVRPPGLLIPIDFGYFNIKLARYAKKLGWQVLYFMPPASWRRDRMGRDLGAITDAVVTPFPWSKPLLEKVGATAHFFGHPLKQLVAEWRETQVTAGEEGSRIAVLPGSRKHEIARNLPLIARIVSDSDLKDYRLEFAVAPSADLEQMRSEWKALAPDRQDLFTPNDVYGVLLRARAGIVCSGTATLEAALLRCPMVVVYQITKAMVRESKIVRFKLPKFISLPNIVLERALVQEFLALEVDAEAVRKALIPLLTDSDERETQIAGFKEIDAELGPSDAITQTAELARSFIKASEKS